MPTNTKNEPAADGGIQVTGEPDALTVEELALSTVSDVRAGAEAATPTMQPPGTAAAATAVGAGWLSNQTVTALWTNSAAPDNVWMHLGGTGWRKLSPGNDNAHLSLTMLAAAARSTGVINAHEGADGTITEIYLW